MANRAAPLALAFALLVGACSSDGGDATATGGETVAADSGTDAGAASGGTEGATDDGGSDGAEAATTDGPGFPSLDVVDLDTGDTVDLGQVLAGSDLPTLLWFWAPH